MPDPYAQQSLEPGELPGELPGGPPGWLGGVAERGGWVLGAEPDGEDRQASFIAVHCRGAGTLAPIARVEPALATLLWLEHGPGPPSAAAGNELVAGLAAAELPIYAIKQGWVAGPPDRLGCVEVDPGLVLAVLDAEARGAVRWERDPDFGYEVPAVAGGVAAENARVLLPRLIYADHDRVYEHAELVARKKRERSELVAALEGLDPAIAAASGPPPAAGRR